MSTNLSVVPSVANAPLPARYEQAKVALAECSQVDECKDWADKAQALASYARQADDEGLFTMARRIQVRAQRRAGELLKTFRNPTVGLIQNRDREGAAPPTGPRTQREAAEMAGISKDQEKTAVRIANVDEEVFEELVEAEKPPTVTALADIGKQSKPPSSDPVYQPKPAGFNEAIHTFGAMREFAGRCRTHKPELIANGLGHYNHDEARRLVGEIDAWLDRFVINIGRETA